MARSDQSAITKTKKEKVSCELQIFIKQARARTLKIRKDVGSSIKIFSNDGKIGCLVLTPKINLNVISSEKGIFPR